MREEKEKEIEEFVWDLTRKFSQASTTQQIEDIIKPLFPLNQVHPHVMKCFEELAKEMDKAMVSITFLKSKLKAVTQVICVEKFEDKNE